MTGMGTHSKPVNGVVTNGHAPSLAPFAVPSELQVRQGGPMAPWPQAAKPDKWRHVTSATAAVLAHRGWLAAIPVILVNAVAFYGQLAFLRGHGHLPAPFAIQALVAVALESIAVYLAWQAHLAQLADDSALRLRLAAYGMAALIAAMNYSHYAAPHWRPTFAALAFALCSAVSPWLWSIHSRRESRDTLKARGLIEPHAVRLGMTRWTWHPLRSPRVMWHATWAGEGDPAKAIALLPAKAPERTVPPTADTPDVRQDDGSTASEEPDISTDNAAGADADKTQDIPVDIDMDKPQARRTRKTVTGLDRAADIIRRNPGLSNADVAKRAHVSEKTVSRARARGQE